MGGNNFTNEQPSLGGVRIQGSEYGKTIPWLLTGRGRVAGNMLDYDGFKAIKHSETQSGGKGGGGKQTTVSYTYQAAVLIGLARGPLVGAGAMWRGKSQFASFAAGGLSLQLGNLGQSVWSWLSTNAPAKALGYSGMAYAYAQAYELDGSASLPNHNFEIDAGGLGSVPGAGTVLDGDPRLAVERLLTDTRSGGGWPGGRLLGLDRYQAYCRAAGLWLSPVLSEQRSAIDWLKQLLMLTNTKAAYTGSALELVPLGDEDLGAHGATFTAEVTPDFDLTLDHFVPDKGDPPVRIRRHVGLGTDAELASSDDVGFNVVTLKIENRASGYVEQPISRDDLASIEQFGRREKEAISAPEIKDAAIGAQVAQQLLQDGLAKRNRYEFNLSWRFCLQKPLRLLTLTVPSLGLDRLPVRVLEVEELDDRRISIVAEDAPIGSATAPRYGAQAGSGYAPDYNASPGSALAPLIFELPGALTTTGLELAIATASTNPMWGGCQVWVSYDGDNYRQLTELRTNSRYGTVQTDGGSTVDLLTNAGQQLHSGTTADAANLATLLYVAPSGSDTGEFMAYETATLTGPNAYTLAGMVRAAYATASVTHDAGAPWARVDDAIARSGPLDPALIGETIHIKLLSFNVFSAATQSLADVSATTYTITGKHFVSPSATLAIKRNVADFAGTLNYNECWIHGHDASGVAIDAPGKILVNGQTVSIPNGLLYGSQGPGAFHIVFDRSASTFTISGGAAGYPYVAARKYGGQWQYDNNSAWTAFTATASHILIGTVETGAPDAGFPGSPPGVTAAVMWAHAATLDAQVASSVPPSIRVTGDNQNAVDLGHVGRGVEILSTGYLHNAGTRGHTLVLWNLATDALGAAPATFDTYVSTASLVTALASVPAGQLVALYSSDATTHDAALRTALQAFGGGLTFPLWTPARVSHVFIGQRGLAPGQAYAASSSASDASGVVSQQAYYTVSSIVKNGAAGVDGVDGTDGTDGTPGAPGANGQTSYLHIKYSNDGGSTFTASSGETPGAYIGTYTDFTLADSTSVGSYTWALIKGADGTNGTPGAAGADGQTSYLHIKWSNDGGSTFTASSGETPGAYIGTYTDFTAADSTSVGAYTWALIKGADGTNGTPGAAGADGQTSYLHIKWSNDGGSTFTASSGETPGAYIGTYTDFTAADSTSVGSYTWALVKGADGTNGTPGAAGSDGQTSYLHIKWSNDGGSTFTASSGETPGAYIGTYTDFTAADSTSVGSYTWALIKGADGTNGTPGTAGSDGTPSYLHIKWSDDGGSTFTASSGETPGRYIGTYTDSTLADSTSVGAYTWALVKGADGSDGDDGASSYLHIKWSDDGGSTFTASSGETPGRYIGTYSDSNPTDSMSVSAYVWALVRPDAPASGSIDTSTTYTNVSNGQRDYGYATATASGGTSPYSYSWAIVSAEMDNGTGTEGIPTVGISSVSTNTAYFRGTAANAYIRLYIECVITDANGLSVRAVGSVEVLHGIYDPP
ncbi:phage tail protein [Roseateles sp. P5_E8]